MKRSRRIYLQSITGTCLPHKCLIAIMCSEIKMIYLTLPFSGLVPDLWIGWAYWKTCKVNTCFQLFGLMSRKRWCWLPCLWLLRFYLIKALVSFKRAYICKLLPKCKAFQVYKAYKLIEEISHFTCCPMLNVPSFV